MIKFKELRSILKEKAEKRYSFDEAEKYFSDTWGKKQGQTIWDPSTNMWMDSEVGELLLPKEKKKPLSAKEYSGDFRNPIK